MIEQRVLAFSLAHPGFGPRRIAHELGREQWGAISLSANGVWGVLRRHGLSTRAKRLGLVAGYAAPPEPARAPEPVRHLEVHRPGELVQLDCFTSDAWPAPRAWCGSTRRWTPTRATCGPSCT